MQDTYSEADIHAAFLRWEQVVAEIGSRPSADTVEQRAAESTETLMGYLRELTPA